MDVSGLADHCIPLPGLVPQLNLLYRSLLVTRTKQMDVMIRSCPSLSRSGSKVLQWIQSAIVVDSWVHRRLYLSHHSLERAIRAVDVPSIYLTAATVLVQRPN